MIHLYYRTNQRRPKVSYVQEINSWDTCISTGTTKDRKKSIPPFHIKTISASNIVLNERKFILNQNVCDKYVT